MNSNEYILSRVKKLMSKEKILVIEDNNDIQNQSDITYKRKDIN